MLPFKNKKITSTLETLEDGHGNSIQVPKFGFLTPNERIETYEKQIEFSQSNRFNPVRLTLEVITVFLGYRFTKVVKGSDELVIPISEKGSHLNDGWREVSLNLSAEEVSSAAGSQTMLDIIYEFFKGEERQWTESDVLLEIRGEEAKAVALNFAKIHPGAIVAASPSMQQFKSWQVFKAADKIPPGYETAMGELSLSATLSGLTLNQ